eukprot:7091129-Pyramimonas_sp.AAC.1
MLLGVGPPKPPLTRSVAYFTSVYFIASPRPRFARPVQRTARRDRSPLDVASPPLDVPRAVTRAVTYRREQREWGAGCAAALLLLHLR